MRTLTVCLAVVVVCAVSAYAQSATGTISYWGATYADYTADDHGTGDVDDTVHFTDHSDMWDYCYQLVYTKWTNNSTLWIDAPFDPLTNLGSKTGGDSVTGSLSTSWHYSYDSTLHRITWTLTGVTGNNDGTTYFQFWNDATGDSPPRHPEPANQGSGRLRFGSSKLTLTVGVGGGRGTQLYTNPEPGGLAFAGIVVGMVGGLWRRRRARKG